MGISDSAESVIVGMLWVGSVFFGAAVLSVFFTWAFQRERTRAASVFLAVIGFVFYFVASIVAISAVIWD